MTDHTWRTKREEKGELRCNSALWGIWNIRRHQNDQNTVGKDDRGESKNGRLEEVAGSPTMARVQ